MCAVLNEANVLIEIVIVIMIGFDHGKLESGSGWLFGPCLCEAILKVSFLKRAERCASAI